MNKLTASEAANAAQESLRWQLPGFTEYDEATDTEYKIEFLGDNRFRFMSEAMDPGKIFVIMCTAREET